MLRENQDVLEMSYEMIPIRLLNELLYSLT